ncbi:hypothetical protein CYK37_26310 [Mesorhizobium loti]|nr:autotransporter domain-containing protein [Mesorhizobium loti]PLP56296.1 hypothetical protein CYK37_26310 [Mesorhizobium loti]
MVSTVNRSGKRRIALLLAGTALVSASSVFAPQPAIAQQIWQGTGPAADFSAAANWNPNGAPNAAQTAVFQGNTAAATVNLNQLAVVDGLRFDAGAQTYSVVLGAAGTLQLGGAGVVNNSGTTQNFVINGDPGHGIVFANTAGAGNASFTINRGGLQFNDSSSAGSALITLGGLDAGIVINNTNGVNSIGALQGFGGVGFYRTTNLSIGSLGTDTTFSGSFMDAGGVGSITKVGTGTLTLSGTNTHTGGTTINAGTLRIDRIAALGTGTVRLNGGTLVGDVTATLGNIIEFNSAASSTIAATNGKTLTLGGALYFNGAVHFGEAGTAEGTIKVALQLGGAGAGTAFFVDGGTLMAGNGDSASMIRNTSVTVAQGATYEIGDSLTGGATTLSGSGTVRVGRTDANASAIVSNGNFAGAIVGTGDLQVNGNLANGGTLTLSGTGLNTYAGSTSIRASHELKGGAANAFNANSRTYVDSGAKLNLGGFDQEIGTLTGPSGAIVLNGGTNPATLTVGRNPQDSTFYGEIQNGTGALSLTKVGSGALGLANVANSFTGQVQVRGGTLLATQAGVLGSTSGAVIVDGPTAVLDLGGAIHQKDAGLSLDGGTIQNGTLTSSGTFTLKKGTASANLAGSGGVVKTSANTVVLGGANSYSGSTSIEDGTLVIVNGGALSTGYVDVNGANAVLLAKTTLTLANSAAMFRNDASVSAATGETLTIAPTSLAFGGTTRIGSIGNAGTVRFVVQSASFPGSAALAVEYGTMTGDTNFLAVLGFLDNVSIANGATLDVAGSPTEVRRLFGSGMVTNSGAATTLSVGKASASSVFDGVITDGAGAISLTKAGTGTFTLTGANTYSGATAINAGTLALSGSGSIANSSGVSIAGGTGFDISATSNGASVKSLSGTGTVALGNRTLELTNASGSFSGVIGGAGGKLLISGGSQTLGGLNTYSGGTTVNFGGTLQAGAAGGLVNHTAYAVNGGMLDLNGYDLVMSSLSGTGGSVLLGAANLTVDQSGDTAYRGDILGTGSLTKQGTGRLTLTGNTIYPGNTRVAGGTLQFGDGAYGGSGLIGSATVSGGTLAFDTPATFTVGGDIELGDTTALSIKAGGSQPSLKANALKLGNAVTFNLSGVSNASQANKVLIDTGGGISGDFGTVSIGGFSGTVDYLTVNTRKSADGKQYLASYDLSWTAGNILAHGTFTLADASNSFTVGANLADQAANAGWGGRSLTKTGNGTLILAGNNSYSGGTTIASGTLQIGNGGATGSIVGDIANEGTLAFNRSGTLVIGGSISGGGKVRQAGTGTVVLSGINSYRGGTEVAAGTLSGNAASIPGDISNAGTVVFDQAASASFGGTIAGLGGVNGAMIKRGAGGLTLTGTSTLDWSVEAGSLTAAATRFSGNAAIGSAATFTFDQATDTSYAGVISGAGNLAKTGSGTLKLTGNSSGFTGSTFVANGILSVDGSLGGTVNVLAGGRLQGKGTLGGLAVANGSIIAPGNSIGTLNVAGDVTLGAGSTYEVEIAGNGTSDRIAATGKATLGGGKVAVTALDAETSYRNGQSYTILTAAGGVTGGFDPAVLSRSAFLDATLAQSANAVDLKISIKGAKPEEPGGNPVFGKVADTENQKQTAGALDTLQQSGTPLELYNKLLVLSADEARGAFDGLSGEINASTVTGLLEDSRFVRDAINDRLRSAFETVGAEPLPLMGYGDDAREITTASVSSERYGAWGSVFGSWGHFGSDGNAAKLSRSTGGFVTGVDGLVTDDIRLGFLAGYSHSSLKVDDRRSSASTDNYHLGIYGGTQWGALALRSGLTYTWSEIDRSRQVAFPGFTDSLTGDYRAGTTQVFGELGYAIKAGNLAFEPFANLAYVNIHTNGFDEKGGAAALNVHGGSNDITFTTLGIRASTDFDIGSAKATVRGMIGWRHGYGDVTPTVSQAFTGSNAFSIAGAPIARNSAVIEAGLDFAIAPAATLGISYHGQVGSRASDHGVRADLNVRF